MDKKKKFNSPSDSDLILTENYESVFPKILPTKFYNINRSFFEKTLEYNWDMELVDRSFDSEKIRKCLFLLEEPDCSFVRELLNKTSYIKYSEFKRDLMQSFEMFKEKIGTKEFYLILPSDKIGSEHWLTALLWSQLRIMNLKEIIDENSDLPSKTFINILIIDDATYTGISTFGKIDAITYLLEKKLDLKSTIEDDMLISSDEYREKIHLIKREVGKWITFHIVTPFISDVSEKFLSDESTLMGINCIFYKIHSLPKLRDLMDIEKYYSNNAQDILRDKFGIAPQWEEQNPVIDMPAVYFDHKVAAPESTFSSIYLNGRLPNKSEYGSLFQINPSRIKIEELEQLYLHLQK